MNFFSVLCFYISWAQIDQTKVDEVEANEVVKNVHNKKMNIDKILTETLNKQKSFGDDNINDLNEAKSKIKMLETKLKQLEARVSKKFPDVHFLNYRARKRILVGTNVFYISFINVVTNCFYLDNWWSWICWISFS